MGIRQTRVFVPSNDPEENWAETLIGKLFRPLTARFSDHLEWFWFSRYGPITSDSSDCDIAKIPFEYKISTHTGSGISHRSMRFRYFIADHQQEAFEQWALQMLTKQGYCVSDFRPYDFVGDTGSNRFLGNENRRPNRAMQRAQLVTQFYMASSRLVIDALVGPDDAGRYRMETNDDFQNPGGSSFQSIHHLYCNITCTPTDVYVFQKAGLDVIGFGTFINPPTAPPGGWDGSTAYSIWF
ncbi:MAG: hypothetical protein PHQ05_08365 [Sterolibacterium sp.]|nr:hypothetical protein [Sterolibacterium sp.]